METEQFSLCVYLEVPDVTVQISSPVISFLLVYLYPSPGLLFILPVTNICLALTRPASNILTIFLLFSLTVGQYFLPLEHYQLTL
jgi:hypothetical protein